MALEITIKNTSVICTFRYVCIECNRLTCFRVSMFIGRIRILSESSEDKKHCSEYTTVIEKQKKKTPIYMYVQSTKIF